MRRLVYVSNNVLLKDHSLNPFFLQEAEGLLSRFGEFKVISPLGSFVCRRDDFFSNFIPNKPRKCWPALFRGCINKILYEEIAHLCRDRKSSLKNLIRLIRFSIDAYRLIPMIEREITNNNPADMLLYSYWLSYDAYACAVIKEKYPQIYALSRAHSYEIQVHRYECNPYLMKDYICEMLDEIVFISQDAMKSVETYHEINTEKMRVQYLGSTKENTGYIMRRKTSLLTLVSCSTINANKQLDWMIEALNSWDIGAVHWIHIGDGDDRERIEQMAKRRLSNNPYVSYSFVGKKPNVQVREFLQSESIDAFVNMSKSEGVPVSIMEAMSAGIPVIAPKIYGIPELIDDACGILFEPSQGTEALRTALKHFCLLTEDERNGMGKAGYLRWRDKFCLEDNLLELFKNAIN